MNAQVPTAANSGFCFEDSFSHEENVESFLNHLDTVDPECAKLLRLHFAEYVSESMNRSEFNRLIADALDQPPPKKKDAAA